MGDKRCIGLWACIELVADKKTKAPLAGFNDSIRNVSGPLAKIFMDNGLYLYSNWDYICISPPIIINRQQIDEMLEIVEKGLNYTDTTENALAIQESIYAQMLKALEAAGGYLCSAEEKAKLQKGMWDEKGALNREIVAQPAEKLSVTMTLYKYKEFSEAIELVNRITAHSGPGHSCGIHTANELRIRELSHKVKVSRIMVRQPQCLANSGAWTNGMPLSMTLGCGPKPPPIFHPPRGGLPRRSCFTRWR